MVLANHQPRQLGWGSPYIGSVAASLPQNRREAGYGQKLPLNELSIGSRRSMRLVTKLE